MTVTLREDKFTFLITFHSFLGEIFKKKRCGGNQNTYFNSVAFFVYRAVYEITWKNIVQPNRPRLRIWHMCIPRCVQAHTHDRCNNSCYSNTIIVAQKHLNGTSHVHCMSC